MALYWDEIESSLFLELSVTKNAGKQSYFLTFMLLDVDLWLHGFLMPLQWDATRQPGLGWALWAPHSSSQPRAALPASGPRSVLGCSIQLPAPLSQPYSLPRGSSWYSESSSALAIRALLLCTGGSWGRTLPRQGMWQSRGTNVPPWKWHGTYRTAAPGDRQRRDAHLPCQKWSFLLPSDFCFTFPPNFKVRRIGVKISSAQDTSLLYCSLIDLPFYCCWPSAVPTWRSNTAWSIFLCKGPSNRCNQHLQQMFLSYFDLHCSVSVRSASLLSFTKDRQNCEKLCSS